MSDQGSSQFDSGEIHAGVADILAAEGPSWLPEQRWFADKGRRIERIELEDLLAQEDGPDLLLLAILRLELAEGTASRYFLPLAITMEAVSGSVIAPAPFLSGSRLLIDGLRAPRFGNWLLELWKGKSALSGSWQFNADPHATALLQQARRSPGLPMGAEQSNTSLRFDEALIVKLFRRLQPGPNPDEEILRVLGNIAFPGVPPFAGSAAWRSADGVLFPIALGQAFVANQGDGWTWMLGRLRTLAASSAVDRFEAERQLGQRTAELHLALGKIDSPDFRPEPVDASSLTADRRRLQEAGERVIELLQEQETRLSDAARSRLPALLRELRQFLSSADGFRAEAECERIRVHGDFHLGQTLRTPNDEWMIIDFEGEPARPVAERRQRASVLKDVAGMLRSFNYARGVIERENLSDAPELSQRLRAWEQGARQAFLEGYREIIRMAEQPLIPAEESAFARALAAWELEKALYEIEYEARNRPDWLEIPLAAVLSGLGSQALDATGAAPA